MIQIILDEATSAIEEYVNSQCKKVHADDCGLDRRCGVLNMSPNGEMIVGLNADRTLQYYGGFEYVDDEHRVVIGEWVVYSDEANRVQKCFEWLEESDD